MTPTEKEVIDALLKWGEEMAKEGEMYNTLSLGEGVYAVYIRDLKFVGLTRAINCFSAAYNVSPKIITTKDGWIPIVTRPLTEEEKEEYPDYACIYECPMPDDCEEVLVSTKWGVSTDTYYAEPDGCYFENYCDEGDVLAWQPKPKPYEGGKDK